MVTRRYLPSRLGLALRLGEIKFVEGTVDDVVVERVPRRLIRGGGVLIVFLDAVDVVAAGR